MGELRDSINESMTMTIERQQIIITSQEHRIADLERQIEHHDEVMNAMILLIRAALGNA